MKKSKLSILLCTLVCLNSCGEIIPESVKDFLNNFTYFNAYTNVFKIDYYFVSDKYDNNKFEGESLGNKSEKFSYEVVDKDKGTINYSDSIKYTGSFVVDNIIEKTISVNLSEDNSNEYIKTTTTYYSSDSGLESPKIEVENKTKSSYEYLIRVGVFGDDSYYQSGLYYGSFLQSISKTVSKLAKNDETEFLKIMSVDSTLNQLTYDPPIASQDQYGDNSLDQFMVVDKYGMILKHETKYYDEVNLQYGLSTINCTYSEN